VNTLHKGDNKGGDDDEGNNNNNNNNNTTTEIRNMENCGLRDARTCMLQKILWLLC
jgi:hypothetical protein